MRRGLQGGWGWACLNTERVHSDSLMEGRVTGVEVQDAEARGVSVDP